MCVCVCVCVCVCGLVITCFVSSQSFLAGAHLAWPDWFHRGVALHRHPIRRLDGNARKDSAAERVCACVKIHISVITEDLDSGRLGPALESGHGLHITRV